jgi:Dullard-like phosphatase family protein
MPNAADASSYFMTLSSKLSQSRTSGGGSPALPLPSTSSSRMSTSTPPQQQQQQQSRGAATAGASSLMTQASRPVGGQSNAPTGGSSEKQSTSSSSPRKKPKVSAVHLIERARYIRSQPKNTSPIEASRHPSLLPRPVGSMVGKKCLILDVDETLVHSSYQPPAHYDVHLPLRVNGAICNVYVAVRPHLQEFLRAVSPLFEVVIFTASVSMYCDPLMNAVDSQRLLGPLRLFREHCSVVNGSYVKDLSLLGRSLDTVTIIDNSPVAYLFQQRNAIPITSWFDDPNDDELLHLIPVLTELARAPTVYDVLDNYNALLQLQQEMVQQEAAKDL